MVTLITMSQGNPIALIRTLESFKDVVTEVIFGDLCVFEDDSKAINKIFNTYTLNTMVASKVIKFPFNYIFKNGFSSILNFLADNATNDIVLYMNVGEVIANRLTPEVNVWTDANAWFFDHPTDPHKWYRMYNRRKWRWNGMIHEEILPLVDTPEQLKAFKPSFTMVDTEKDMDNPFKAKVYNDIKELVYFNQYQRLIDEPESRGVTNEYWLREAQQADPPMIARLLKKGKRFEAFKTGNLEMYMDDIKNNPEFAKERDESSNLINVQGNRKDVL